MPVAELLERHAAEWRRAVHHPFLHAVRDGILPAGAFDTWLVQDARFVADLLRFQDRLLARAPHQAHSVLAGGVTALGEELRWFEQQAAARGLDMAAPALPATARYVELLDRLDSADVPSALVALWTIERAYLDAWTGARPGAPEYRTFVEHWTTPAFADYVAGLEVAAERAGPSDADAVFLEVVAAEIAFWDMAVDAR